jgi:hypothetical protein
MSTRFDAKTLVIGLLLGACATLSLGQAVAEQEPRFEITGVATTDKAGASQTSIYVLEHRTGQIVEYKKAADNQWQRTPAFQINR